MIPRLFLAALFSAVAATSFGQDDRSRAPDRPDQLSGQLVGRVTDQTGGTLPGVVIELRDAGGPSTATVTSDAGEYAFDGLPPGAYQAAFSMMNFSEVRRDVIVEPGTTHIDVVLHLSLNAEVTVMGRRTFANLADVENPAENLPRTGRVNMVVGF